MFLYVFPETIFFDNMKSDGKGLCEIQETGNMLYCDTDFLELT